MGNAEKTSRRSERGTVMVIAALAMTALLLFAALAIDVGAVWSSRTQSQNAADAAALAAASKMIVPPASPGDAATVDLDSPNGARAEGVKFAGANATVGEAVTGMAGNLTDGVTVRDPDDFAFGTWNLDTRTFTPQSGAALNDPELVRAAEVTVHMDGNVNKRSPAFLSRLLGIGGYEVTNTAIAYLGFKGKFDPKWFNFPVALDSCDLSNENGCGTDFCSRAADTPAACALERPQNDTNGILCGEFSNTADQDMCWTVFDGSRAPVTPKDLKDCVDEPCSGQVDAGDNVYVDNGEKTTVVDYIRDKFYGCGEFDPAASPPGPGPAGRDEYGSTFPDSWVRKLPVIECQDTTHCSHRDTYAITGGVCFEIREVIAPGGPPCPLGPNSGTSRWIKGRALCPNSTNAKVRELYNKYCVDPNDPNDPPVAPGGCNFGFSAEKVVLVQ